MKEEGSMIVYVKSRWNRIHFSPFDTSNVSLYLNIGAVIGRSLSEGWVCNPSEAPVVSGVSLQPVRGSGCFLKQDTTLIAKYWLVCGTYTRLNEQILLISNQPEIY